MIELHDSRIGIPAEAARARLMSGWLVVPGIAIDEPAVVTPGRPDPIKKADAWIPPMYGATMPQAIVVKAMLHAADHGSDIVTLETMAQMLFQRSLSELRAVMMAEMPTGKEPVDAD